MTRAHRVLRARRRTLGRHPIGPSWGTHAPTRPGWDCGACSLPWPCAVAQHRLLAAYRGERKALAIVLSILREQAVLDLSDTDPRQIGARFTDWYRSARRDAAAVQPTDESREVRAGTRSPARQLRRCATPIAVARLDLLFAMIIPAASPGLLHQRPAHDGGRSGSGTQPGGAG